MAESSGLKTELNRYHEAPRQFREVEEHYDTLIDMYEQFWGEHLHHGYWDDPTADPHIAQERMVQELVTFANVEPGSYVLDAGCGVGAPAFYLAGELGCRIDAITLSQEQVTVASARAAEAGLSDSVHFHRQNALATNFPDNSFDVVWALESLELMPDKSAFFAEALRVLRPGGRLVVATWCLRPEGRQPTDASLLRRVYHDFAIPYLLPLSGVHQTCTAAGFTDVATDDWTEHVRQTWDVTPELTDLLTKDPARTLNLARERGTAILRFLDGLPAMHDAYAVGAVRYGALRAVKPTP